MALGDHEITFLLAGQRQVGLADLALATVFAGRTAANARAADSLLKTVNCSPPKGQTPFQTEPLVSQALRKTPRLGLSFGTDLGRDFLPCGSDVFHSHTRSKLVIQTSQDLLI